MPRDGVTLTMAALKEAYDQLAYLNAPCEARLSNLSLKKLRVMLEPPPERPLAPTSLVSSMYGLKLVVDEDLPFNRIEFRDRDGKVMSTYDLP